MVLNFANQATFRNENILVVKIWVVGVFVAGVYCVEARVLAQQPAGTGKRTTHLDMSMVPRVTNPIAAVLKDVHCSDFLSIPFIINGIHCCWIVGCGTISNDCP
jgi:hypothetical protein